MSTTDLATDLQHLPARAAALLDRVGWTQGTERDDTTGAMCLTGALRYCRPLPGDWLIARAVFRRRAHAEDWNDAAGRTAAEVQAYLRSVEITDGELEQTFGPQWEAIVTLTRTAATLTPDQCARLSAAAWAATRAAAWAATRAATRAAARAAARDAAWAAAWDATWAAAWAAARDATDATRALVVRDVIGQHGLTQDHYDCLTAPWVSVMGAVHPDDRPVSA